MTERDVSKHDAAPGGNDHAKGCEEGSERSEERIGEEDNDDRSDGHDGAVDCGGNGAGHRDASCQQGKSRRIDIHNDSTDKTKDCNDREGDQEPGRKNCCQRTDWVVADGFRESVIVGTNQQHTEDHQDNDGQRGTCGRPADDTGG